MTLRLPSPFPAALLALALGLTACGPRRPAFDDAKAQDQIASLFERDSSSVALYTSQGGREEAEWLVEFRVDGDSANYQARFSGASGEWKLVNLRERSPGGQYGAWVEPGIVFQRAEQEMGTRAEATMKTMAELARLVERYATENGLSYPAVDIAGLQELVVSGGFVKEWKHSADAWGNGLLYHGSPDGQTYLIVSRGADGQFDRDPAEYFAASDAGNEAYGGISSDPNVDLIYATGAFVQSYVPAP